MNKITSYGRVATDVELKDVSGRNVATFSLASQNKNKTTDETGKAAYGTNFYRVSVWGPSADSAAKYLKKGHRVTVSGDLVIRDYTGSDHQKHTAVEINNAEYDLVETKAESEAKAQATGQAQPQQQYQAPAYQPTAQTAMYTAPQQPTYQPQQQQVYQAAAQPPYQPQPQAQPQGFVAQGLPF